MSKAKLRHAAIWQFRDDAPKLTVELIVNGKVVKIEDMPVSNEMMKEMVATFKRHLPKPEDIA